MQAALDELTALGILERDDTRRIQFFRINRHHDLVAPLASFFEAESRRIVILQEAVRELLDGGAVREHTLSIILFGSNARGDASPASDLDLLAVTEDASQVERVLEVLIDGIPEIQRRRMVRLGSNTTEDPSRAAKYLSIRRSLHRNPRSSRRSAKRGTETASRSSPSTRRSPARTR